MTSTYHTCTGAVLLLVALAGCSTVVPQSGRDGVSAALAARGLRIDSPTVATDALAVRLDQPLGRAEVLRVALANNPAVNAQLARLGFAAAEVYDAARLSNPVLGVSLLVPDEGHEADQLGFGLAQSFTDLLLLPARERFAQGQFERVQQLVAAAVLDLAAEVDTARVQLLAAERTLQMRAVIARTAAASAGLAGRFHAAGNISSLELARERAASGEAELARIEAAASRDAARTVLNRLMGLDAGAPHWTLVDELAEPEALLTPLPDLLAQASRTRLDLAAARREVELRADAAGVARDTRLLGDIELGVETERDTDRTRKTGPSLALELPLFNQGHGRVARAEAELMLAAAELRALELEAGAAVRGAYEQAGAALERATQYRTALVPLHEDLVRLTQQRLDFMLSGQFEALLVRQQEFAAYAGYLDAVRDYWLARIALARAMGSTLPPVNAPPLASPTLPEAAPADAHRGHPGDAVPAAADPHAGHTMQSGHAPAAAPAHSMHHGMHHAPAEAGSDGQEVPAPPAPAPAASPAPDHSHHGGGPSP